MGTAVCIILVCFLLHLCLHLSLEQGMWCKTSTNKHANKQQHTNKKKPSNISISYRRGVEVSSAECESEVLGIESQQNRAGYFGPDRLLHRAETVVGPAGRLESNSQALSSLWMPLGVPLVI